MGCIFSRPLPLRWNRRKAAASPRTTGEETLGVSDPVELRIIVHDTTADGPPGGKAHGTEQLPEAVARLGPVDESAGPKISVSALTSQSTGALSGSMTRLDPTDEPATNVTSITTSPSKSADGSGEPAGGTSRLPAQTSLKQTGWLALEKTLTAVKECSDLFPPLKTAAAGVLAVMDVVDVNVISCGQNCVGDAQDGFFEIARRINGIQDTLSRYGSEQDVPFIIRERLERFSDSSRSEKISRLKENVG
ncbi:hypothetical protein OBBRIDRAFT_803497 [Obba rivulosa]|uniref:Uncharacterized protein n=1 Tax=Obba rivulosa TaxID=1052685 RepID=A0A8E2DMM2_9APHY|nr:hypothetical protein OBBRIDRAFT_803497 [Obba rivulosa]